MKNKLTHNKTLLKVLVGASVATIAAGTAVSISAPIINSKNAVKHSDKEVNENNNKVEAAGKIASTTLKCISKLPEESKIFYKLQESLDRYINAPQIPNNKCKWIGELGSLSLNVLLYSPKEDKGVLLNNLLELISIYVEGIFVPQISDIQLEAIGHILSKAPLAYGWAPDEQINNINKTRDMLISFIRNCDQSLAIPLAKAFCGINTINFYNDLISCDGIWESCRYISKDDDPIEKILDPVYYLCCELIFEVTDEVVRDALVKIGATLGQVMYKFDITDKEIFNNLQSIISVVYETKCSATKTEVISDLVCEFIMAYSLNQGQFDLYNYLFKKVCQSILSNETTDLQAKGIGYAARSGFLATAKQPEACGAFNRMIFNAISHIQSNNEQFAIAYGLNNGSWVKPTYFHYDDGEWTDDDEVADGSLMGIARQPESEEKLASLVELGNYYISLCTTTAKAESIAMLIARTCSAVARQPEAYKSIQRVITPALLRVIQDNISDNKAYWICKCASTAAQGVGKQPEATNKVREALESTIDYISNEITNAKIQGVGLAGYTRCISIAYQPDAEKPIDAIFEQAVKVIHTQDDSLALPIGITVGGNIDTLYDELDSGLPIILNGALTALIRKYDADGVKLMQEALNFIDAAARESNNEYYLKALGDMGAEIAAGLSRVPDTPARILQFAKTQVSLLLKLVKG